MTPSQPLPLSASGHKLSTRLAHPEPVADNNAPTFHVASIGNTFYFAYEQLRNITEYREHHLLLRGAIERFMARQVSWDKFRPAAAELITELTQAGYLKNDTVPVTTVHAIDEVVQGYSTYYAKLIKDGQLGKGTAGLWLRQIGSVKIENLITPDQRVEVMMNFAYEHYYNAIDPADFGETHDSETYRTALFCATQRTLFKSDIATARAYCASMSLPEPYPEPVGHFIHLNKMVDAGYEAPLSNHISRLINRYGAPMRVLRELVMSATSTEGILQDRNATLSRVKLLCRQLYTQAHERLSRRIIRTILFVLITKVLIGVAIEIPYDLLVHNLISWRPLLINVSLPVIYMAALGLTIPAPGPKNAEATAAYLDRILYQTSSGPVQYRLKKRVTSSSLNTTFAIIYAIGFIGSLVLLAWILYQLGYNVVNALIFFVFFSAISFLGFRLRQSARELALLDERPSLPRAFGDFLSTPFVSIGHWLSDKYARANIITRLLDVAIEMPLKTSLRLIQQWIGFMRDKQEEL